ncbi:Beta-lactamase-like protein 2 homolog [Linum perenne]
MSTHILALILSNASNDDEFILLRQTPPPKFNDQEYDSFVDSHLWDLPSTKLNPVEALSGPEPLIDGADSLIDTINLRNFDLDAAITRLLGQVGFKASDVGKWRVSKFIEEPEFGPGLPIRTVYVVAKLALGGQPLPDLCKWMSVETCLTLLHDVKPGNDRVGSLAVVGLVDESMRLSGQKIQTNLRYQEYPPGVILVPMTSRTAKPFCTTNLIIFAPENISNEFNEDSSAISGDVLIVDPGCQTHVHEELLKIVGALSGKLIIFVTHHHPDHVDGLSVIEKCKPDAKLLAHENTMRRIKKDDWSRDFTLVSGGEDILIGNQRLKVISAPGHTDGHLALLHVNTHSLIVGDHCVGQGSAVLDITAGGNMTDYFQSTYMFIDLSPHTLIPMHGRVNLWPKNMLCGYLKNRRSREAAVLKAIEMGDKTLIDIVANVYSEVDRSFWIPAASNVRLHVTHLEEQGKLPEGFSMERFERTYGAHFFCRWAWMYLTSGFSYKKCVSPTLVIAGAVAGLALTLSVRKKLISK